MKLHILNTLLDQRLLPLFYHRDEQTSISILKTLYKAGIRTIEYTNRGAEAFQNFKAMKALQRTEMPDLYLGIGTIKSAEEAENFINLGADFIVCPIVNPEVAQCCEKHQVLWIPGCMTPTEIYTAQQLNAPLIKLFPANILGPSFVAAIRELFAGQLFIPTGGVEIEENNLRSWFEAGVCAVGIGSRLVRQEFIEKEDNEGLYQLTTKALQMLKTIRE